MKSLNNERDQVHRVDLDTYILDSGLQLPASVDEFGLLMDLLYQRCFELFIEKWCKVKPGIMEFNTFLEEIYGNDLKKKIPGLLKEFDESRKQK